MVISIVPQHWNSINRVYLAVFRYAHAWLTLHEARFYLSQIKIEIPFQIPYTSVKS